MSKTEIKFPAEVDVHWATGPVSLCQKHANDLITLGKFMGCHTPATVLLKPAECKQCVIQSEDNDND